MTEENKIPHPPAPAASAAEDCVAPRMMETKKEGGRSSYIISADGKMGERVIAFVEGPSMQSGKLNLDENSSVSLMGSKSIDSGRIDYENQAAEGNRVKRVLTREQMLDPSESNYMKDPQLAAKIRGAAKAMAECSDIGPAMELLSAHPSKPLPTPGGQVQQRQK